MDIAFIAPFERIQIKAQSIIDTTNYPAKTYLGDLDKGVKAAEQALRNGAKIIISRGGTARMIRQQLDVEVIEVEASVYNTLAFLHDDTEPSTKVAIVGFKQLINMVQPVCDILGRIYQSFEIKDRSSFQQEIEIVKQWQPDIVIGDAISYHWARDHGLNAYLIESSMETLVDAFERAMLVLNNINRHLSHEKRLAAVLNCTQEGALLVNQEGIIREANRQSCKLFRRSHSDMIGKNLTDIFASKEVSTAFHSRKDTRNIIINQEGRQIVIDLKTIDSEDGVANATVLLFQPIDKIRETGNAIRKKLIKTGFYAKYTFGDIQHKSPNMKELVEKAKQYSITDSNIMIMGETGTGKELFAQSIHNGGPLSSGPFVAVNCAALSATLLESELFGYAPGAFTGALRSGKTGLFELANDGTLFLDEITEMDIFLQSKLLRVLQTREIMKIGDNKVIPVNIRIVAATNKDPLEEVKLKKLRMDLYYRLNVLDLQIPALRDRNEDSIFLFMHFLTMRAHEKSVTITPPSPKLLNAINKYDWPGNVRELENFADKYIALQNISNPDSLATSLMVTGKTTKGCTLNEMIADKVIAVFKQENGNISRTAELLGIDRNTVKRWLKKSEQIHQVRYDQQ